MVFFNKNKGKIIDYSQNYTIKSKKVETQTEQPKQNSSNYQTDSNFGFFDNISSSVKSSSYNSNENNSSLESPEERKSKLAKRLLDMTNKIEDLSNQIYHLTQRVELIEKRLKINFD